MTMECRLCKSKNLEVLIDLGALPIAHRMLRDPDETEETFPLALHICNDCGLGQIVEPIDPAVLYNGFNFNFSSWKPEPHLDDELDLIIEGGVPERVVEIGCNDGLFLHSLRERGVTTVVGIEPNPVPGATARERGLTVFTSMIDPGVCDDAIDAAGGKFDFVVSRQVLEHVLDLDNFLQCADRMLCETGQLFIDVPDFEHSLASGDCSMIWEEHVSYFTESSLLHLFARHGFVPEVVRRYDFSGGTIAVRARRGVPAPVTTTVIPGGAEQFDRSVKHYRERLAASLSTARRAGMQVVLYGTGCRACTVVNGLDLGGLIDFAVDDQPERQGLFMPGSRLAIRPTDTLVGDGAPFICLLAVNNENEDKVTEKIRTLAGSRAICATILGPKDLLQVASTIEQVCTTADVGA